MLAIINFKAYQSSSGKMKEEAEYIIKKFRSIGIKVIEKSKMHEKIALIDNAIAWEGSLNILSHRDTGEHMRRLEGTSTVEEIIKNLELAEDIPPEICPKCGEMLVVRIKYRKKFFGCSGYPKCRYTKSLKRK